MRIFRPTLSALRQQKALGITGITTTYYQTGCMTNLPYTEKLVG